MDPSGYGQPRHAHRETLRGTTAKPPPAMTHSVRALKAVARGDSSVSVSCSLAGGARAVPVQHLARPPAEQAHGVTFSPTLGHPDMSRGVPQLMWMDLLDTGL